MKQVRTHLTGRFSRRIFSLSLTVQHSFECWKTEQIYPWTTSSATTTSATGWFHYTGNRKKKHCLHILAYLPHAGVWECIINYCLQTPNIWCGRNAQCMLHKVHSPQLHAASGSSTTSLQHQHQLWSLRKHTGTNFNQTMPPDFSSS